MKWNGPLADGLSWYLQSHVTERLFDSQFQIKAYALDSSRYFGGFVPWEFRGLYLGRASRVLERDVDPRTGRIALAFATLERQLGWPVLQRVLRVIAERPERAALDAGAFTRIAADAAGQDMDWFTSMLDETASFDPAIGHFASERSGECAADTVLSHHGWCRASRKRGVSERGACHLRRRSAGDRALATATKTNRSSSRVQCPPRTPLSIPIASCCSTATT